MSETSSALTVSLDGDGGEMGRGRKSGYNEEKAAVDEDMMRHLDTVDG